MNKSRAVTALWRVLLVFIAVWGVVRVLTFYKHSSQTQLSTPSTMPFPVINISSLPLPTKTNPAESQNSDSFAGIKRSDSANHQLPCDRSQGKVIKDYLYSDTFKQEIPFQVYLPPCAVKFDLTASSYPTLYLLHGQGSNESQWVNFGLGNKMDAAIKADSPSFIVVMPYLSDMQTWPSDSNATFFINELIPTIDNRYPTLSNRQHRAIGGLSRGAAWALRIGLTHPDYFAKIGLHSLPLFDDEINHWVSILRALETTSLPQLFMDSGKSDKDMGSGVLFHEWLQSFMIPHEYRLFEGSHDEAYWRNNLPTYLEWYSKGW